MLTTRKYRTLFSPKRIGRPGPKGPAKELIDAVVEMKRRNPGWGCRRIAQQIALAFGLDIDKDVVRRILAVHFRPESGSSGPSWLTFWDIRRTVCGAPISFAANPSPYERIGFSWSWTNSHVGSSGLVFIEGMLTGMRYVECSSKPFGENLCPNISAPTMIRYIDSISGKPIFAFWK